MDERLTADEILAWLAKLPADFEFQRKGVALTCDCLVGRYLNEWAEPGQEWSVGNEGAYLYNRETLTQVKKVVLGAGVRQLIHTFDGIAPSRTITAGELRHELWAGETK